MIECLAFIWIQLCQCSLNRRGQCLKSWMKVMYSLLLQFFTLFYKWRINNINILCDQISHIIGENILFIINSKYITTQTLGKVASSYLHSPWPRWEFCTFKTANTHRENVVQAVQEDKLRGKKLNLMKVWRVQEI